MISLERPVEPRNHEGSSTPSLHAWLVRSVPAAASRVLKNMLRLHRCNCTTATKLNGSNVCNVGLFTVVNE